MFSMSCTLVLYRAVKPASLPLLYLWFVILHRSAFCLTNLYKVLRRDSSDCNSQTHPRSVILWRACLPPVVSCTGACTFHCFGKGQRFLHCLPIGRCLCAMRLFFSAFAIASPFAKMSGFQLCASCGPHNRHIIMVISIYVPCIEQT